MGKNASCKDCPSVFFEVADVLAYRKEKYGLLRAENNNPDYIVLEDEKARQTKELADAQ